MSENPLFFLSRPRFLALLVFDAIAVLIVICSFYMPLAETNSSAAVSSSADRSPPFHKGQIAYFPDTLTRPLFMKSRRPYQVPVVPMPVPQPMTQPSADVVEDLRPVLKGVLITASRKRACIFTDRGGEGIWIEEGEKVKGWTLRTINVDSVILAQGSQLLNLHLYGDKPSR